MRANHRWVLVAVALALGVFLLLQNRVFAKPTDEHKWWDIGIRQSLLFPGTTEWHAVGMGSGRDTRRPIPTKLRWGSWIFRNWSFGFWARMRRSFWGDGI